MKKFKIIRNILIVLIILIAVIYICWMRSSKTENSKTAKLYNKMFVDSYREQKNITMEIEYSNEKAKIKIVQATDNKEGKEISCTMYENNDYIKKDPESEGAIIYTVTTDNDVKFYRIFPKLKEYQVTIEEQEGKNYYDNWIQERLSEVEGCKYYTKGYEFVNGKLLYCENFKEKGLKAYFDKDELVYMKSTEIDEGVEGIENGIYSIKIMYDDSYKKYTEIPAEYKGYITKYNEETDELERIEIK